MIPALRTLLERLRKDRADESASTPRDVVNEGSNTISGTHDTADYFQATVPIYMRITAVSVSGIDANNNIQFHNGPNYGFSGAYEGYTPSPLGAGTYQVQTHSGSIGHPAWSITFTVVALPEFLVTTNNPSTAITLQHTKATGATLIVKGVGSKLQFEAAGKSFPLTAAAR